MYDKAVVQKTMSYLHFSGHANSVRPHSSLNNMTPEHFCRQYGKNLNSGENLKN